MFSFPAAFIFGVVGIIRDRRKLLAISTTLISVGLVFYWAFTVGN